MKIDFIYRDLAEKCLYEGETKHTRSGETLSVFGAHYVYDLSDGFPLLSTKKINFTNIIYELNWMLSGSTNISTLSAPQLWDLWADDYGNLPGIYGENWRQWGGYAQDKIIGGVRRPVDQIKWVIEELTANPNSRRALVSAWNPMQAQDHPEVPNACHTSFQLNVRKGAYLDLHLYQRSADVAIGLPYNIAFYALLLRMFCRELSLGQGCLIHSIGDMHVYKSHVANLKVQLSREPREAPSLLIEPFKSFWELVRENNPLNYNLEGYNPHPFVKYEVAK